MCTKQQQWLTHAAGVQGLLWETSLLDPEDGIRFRGHSIPQLQVLILHPDSVYISGSRVGLAQSEACALPAAAQQ